MARPLHDGGHGNRTFQASDDEVVPEAVPEQTPVAVDADRREKRLQFRQRPAFVDFVADAVREQQGFWAYASFQSSADHLLHFGEHRNADR